MITLSIPTAALAKKPGGGGGGSGGGGGGSTSTLATVIDYSQCANGAPPSTSLACPDGWINGALQSSNSHYREDDATPQRVLVNVPSAGRGDSVTHTLTFSYLTRKGSANAHAYDSLTSFNLTQTGAEAERCKGYAKKVTCDSLSPKTTFEIPLDPTEVAPGSDPTTSAHQRPGVMTMYGGTLTSVAYEDPIHTDPSGTGDDYATIIVSYKVPTTNSSGNVQLLFGGHLAPSTGQRGWGAGLGAASISGGPYHIKFTNIDGASAGSRDNQIQASAIQALPPEFSIDKSVNTTAPVEEGATVTYTVKVTNSGDAGTARVEDTYQEGVSIIASSLPSYCSNDSSTRTITCDVPVGSKTTTTFTYKATMPLEFDDLEHQNLPPCTDGTFRVRNTAKLANGTSDSADVCVNADPDFSILKQLKNSSQAPPNTVAPNTEVTYTVRVTNTGDAPGSKTFTDPLTNLTLVDADPSCTGTTSLTCTTRVLKPGEFQDFEYTAKVPATFSGTPNESPCAPADGKDSYKVTNTATLVGGPSSSAIVCVRAKADLVPDKSASPSTSTLNGIVKYTISVTNNGDAAGGGSFKDEYQTGVTILNTGANPLDPRCTNDATNRVITCTVASLAPGASTTFTYWAKMPSAKPATGTGCASNEGRVVNKVTIVGTTNTDTETVCLPTAEFVPSKSANPTNVNAGDNVAYTLTITNTGSIAGTPSEPAVDVYPEGVTIVTSDADLAAMGCTHVASERKISCTFGSIAAGQSASKSFVAKMPSSFTTPPGTNQCPTGQYRLVNKVTINGITAEAPNCVKADPVLGKTKSASPTGSVNPGTEVTYTVTISNTGKAPGSTTFVDHYDEGVTPVTTSSQFTAMGCTLNSDARTITCTTNSIQPGANQQFVYKLKMPTSYEPGSLGGSGCAPTELAVTNSVSFPTGTPTSVTLCVKMPVLNVNKQACTAQAIPVNGLLAYTISYSNTGSAPATNTVVSDDIPSGTTVANAGGGTVTGGTISWNIGTLAAGGSGSKTFTVSVNPGTAGPLVNVAEIESTETSDTSNTVTNAVGNLGASAIGRAYGATVSLLGATLVPPTPQTAATATNNNVATSLLTLPSNPLANLGLLTVSNQSEVRASEAEDSATSSVANVNVNLLGLVTVEAAAVVAKSVSTASGFSADSNTNGSRVVGLKINGKLIGDVSSPRTETIVNLLGIPVAEVLILEHTQRSGAALGGAAGAQPQGGMFNSGIAVNGIRVRLLDGTASVTVAHAESKAAFPTATPCAGTGSYVIGRAVNVDASITSPLAVVRQRVNEVILGSAGGNPFSTTNTLLIPGLAASGTGWTASQGSLSPLGATSTASIENLVLGPPGGISAQAVQSTATATPSSKTGSTTITNLKIGGITICVICDPVAPNTVLANITNTLKVVLNEQIVTGNQITVNAIHIYVLGPNNPLGLPVNSDVIVNGATAGTS